MKNATPCIFPENDIWAAGVETGSIGKHAAMASPTEASSRNAKPKPPRRDDICATSAANRDALAAANAAKHSAINQPCRPSAYRLIIFRDGWTLGLRTCSAARAITATTAAAMTARAASMEQLIRRILTARINFLQSCTRLRSAAFFGIRCTWANSRLTVQVKFQPGARLHLSRTRISPAKNCMPARDRGVLRLISLPFGSPIGTHSRVVSVVLKEDFIIVSHNGFFRHPAESTLDACQKQSGRFAASAFVVAPQEREP